MKIALISGTSRKFDKPMPAGELYKKSPLFRYGIEFCQRQYNQVFVLSPKYGLLPVDKEIEPYDLALANIQRRAFKEWIEKVVEQIKQTILEGSELYVHAGKRFRKLIPYLKDYQCHEPMANMGIGRQLKWYRKQLGY